MFIVSCGVFQKDKVQGREDHSHEWAQTQKDRTQVFRGGL